MSDTIVILAIFAIVACAIANIFTMKNSPNPNCLQDHDDIESKCPFMCEKNDQRNT